MSDQPITDHPFVPHGGPHDNACDHCCHFSGGSMRPCSAPRSRHAQPKKRDPEDEGMKRTEEWMEGIRNMEFRTPEPPQAAAGETHQRDCAVFFANSRCDCILSIPPEDLRDLKALNRQLDTNICEHKDWSLCWDCRLEWLTESYAKGYAQGRADGLAEGIEEAASAIPTTWLDSLLSGPESPLPAGAKWDCQAIEALLNGVRARIRALPGAKR